MKIHIDYLEDKIEDFERSELKVEAEKKSMTKKLYSYEERLKTVQD